MHSPNRQRDARVMLAAAIFGTALCLADTAGADELGVDVPPPRARVRTLEQPPEFGVYYDRWEPTFYTGFAPRTLDPARLHLHVGRGNQLRATAVLSDRVLVEYARDLDARVTTYRRLIDQKRLVSSQNTEFAKMEATLAGLALPKLLEEESTLEPAALRRRNLALMERLNPGRVFEVEISEDTLIESWLARLEPGDRKLLDRRRRLDLVNALLPTRLWIAELDSATRQELGALLKLAPRATAEGEAAIPDAFREAYFALLGRITDGRYPRSDGKLRFAEFTAIYPIGTFNEYTEYKGHPIPLYPTPGRRALTTHQRTKTVDHIPTKANYSYSPWIPYMHVGETMHNSFHTLWWRMEPEKAEFLPPEWLNDDPRRAEGPSRFLWLLSRGPMSSGCTHLNVGHIAELRQLLPSEASKLAEVDVFLNRSYNYDVFDIDGDLKPEVMGVRYFVAYSLRNKQPHRLRVRNERHAFYEWLYGDEIRTREDDSVWFPEVQDGRFVERTAQRGETFHDVDLYEAAYEPERVQFYTLVDIDFARRLRQVAYAHPFDSGETAKAR